VDFHLLLSSVDARAAAADIGLLLSTPTDRPQPEGHVLAGCDVEGYLPRVVEMPLHELKSLGGLDDVILRFLEGDRVPEEGVSAFSNYI
jgi:hypothetical protein